jgi:hypothetical protein
MCAITPVLRRYADFDNSEARPALGHGPSHSRYASSLSRHVDGPHPDEPGCVLRCLLWLLPALATAEAIPLVQITFSAAGLNMARPLAVTTASTLLPLAARKKARCFRRRAFYMRTYSK